MGKYSICKGFVVLDENSEIIDWFDTEEEAETFAEELEDETENDEVD